MIYYVYVHSPRWYQTTKSKPILGKNSDIFVIATTSQNYMYLPSK